MTPVSSCSEYALAARVQSVTGTTTRRQCLAVRDCIHSALTVVRASLDCVTLCLLHSHCLRTLRVLCVCVCVWNVDV